MRARFVRTTIATAFATAALAVNLGSNVVLRAAPPPPQARPLADKSMITEKIFDQWFYSCYGGPEATLRRWSAMAQGEISLLDRLFGLTTGQQRKLELACRGDVSRYLERAAIARVAAVNGCVTVDDERRWHANIRRWVADVLGREVARGALFRKSLAQILPPEKLAEYNEFKKSQRLRQLRALIANAMVYQEESVPLTTRQRQALAELLESETRDYRDPWQYRLSILRFQISQISLEKLQSILDEPQVEAWSRRLIDVRGLNVWLGYNGLSPLLLKDQIEEFQVEEGDPRPLPLRGGDFCNGLKDVAIEELQVQLEGKLHREVSFVDRCCSTTSAQRKSLLAAGEKSLRESLQRIPGWQDKPEGAFASVDLYSKLGGRAWLKIPADTLPRLKQSVLDESVRVLSPAQKERLEKEVRDRRDYLRRARTALQVASVDRNLVLTQPQWESLASRLFENWNDQWDFSIRLLADDLAFPLPIPEHLLAGILTQSQLTTWKAMRKRVYLPTPAYQMTDRPFELPKL